MVPEEVALPAATDVVAGKIVELAELEKPAELELGVAEAMDVVGVVVVGTLGVDVGELEGGA